MVMAQVLLDSMATFYVEISPYSLLHALFSAKLLWTLVLYLIAEGGIRHYTACLFGIWLRLSREEVKQDWLILNLPLRE